MVQKDIETLKKEISRLKQTLREKENRLEELLKSQKGSSNVANIYCNGLSKDDVSRYSRQMLIPKIGVSGQKALRQSKVLIVGVGGLGCPAALYLATAGVGQITLVDYDDVELSNLHRQVLHSEDDIGIPKVKSAYETLHRINGNIKIVPLKIHATSSSIKKVIEEDNFTVVVDGTDNVATRYLLNDICVLNGLPLVSGSALQMEGQLSVYNYEGGPCYRCLFPVPPPPESVKSCGDGGVLGPIPGTIGLLQALETIKIIANLDGVMTGRLLLFDGSNCTFRNIKLRPRNVKCEVCGDVPVIKELIDYEQFCGAGAHDKVVDIDILNATESIDIKEFNETKQHALVIDVRPEIEFDMCQLPNTVNIPLSVIEKDSNVDVLRRRCEECTEAKKVYVLCRRGNDSQRAIVHLKTKLGDLNLKFFNVERGLHAYSKRIDDQFPVY